MSSETGKYLKFGGAVAVILVSLGFLAYTGVQESKSYYVTIKELRGMGDGAYTKHLRVAGNVQPGSIKRSGTSVNFVLIENDQLTAGEVRIEVRAPATRSASEWCASGCTYEEHDASRGWQLR